MAFYCQLVPSNLSYFAIRDADHNLVITGQYVHNLVLISVYLTILKQIKWQREETDLPVFRLG